MGLKEECAGAFADSLPHLPEGTHEGIVTRLKPGATRGRCTIAVLESTADQLIGTQGEFVTRLGFNLGDRVQVRVGRGVVARKLPPAEMAEGVADGLNFFPPGVYAGMVWSVVETDGVWRCVIKLYDSTNPYYGRRAGSTINLAARQQISISDIIRVDARGFMRPQVSRLQLFDRETTNMSTFERLYGAHGPDVMLQALKTLDLSVLRDAAARLALSWSKQGKSDEAMYREVEEVAQAMQLQPRLLMHESLLMLREVFLTRCRWGVKINGLDVYAVETVIRALGDFEASNATPRGVEVSCKPELLDTWRALPADMRAELWRQAYEGEVKP